MVKKTITLHNNDLLISLNGEVDHSDLIMLKDCIHYFKKSYNIKNIIFDTKNLTKLLDDLESLDDEII